LIVIDMDVEVEIERGCPQWHCRKERYSEVDGIAVAVIWP